MTAEERVKASAEGRALGLAARIVNEGMVYSDMVGEIATAIRAAEGEARDAALEEAAKLLEEPLDRLRSGSEYEFTSTVGMQGRVLAAVLEGKAALIRSLSSKPGGESAKESCARCGCAPHPAKECDAWLGSGCERRVRCGCPAPGGDK